MRKSTRALLAFGIAAAAMTLAGTAASAITVPAQVHSPAAEPAHQTHRECRTGPYGSLGTGRHYGRHRHVCDPRTRACRVVACG